MSSASMSAQTARLLITCRDARGIIAAVTNFLAEHGGNVLDLDQHTDPDRGEFFMRVEIELAGFGLDPSNFVPAWAATGGVPDRFDMRWWIYWGSAVKKMAIMISRESHCLNDLLWRWKTGELNVEIPLVISNHADLQASVVACEVPFHHLPISPSTKPAQERQVRTLVEDAGVDFIVLARYMQILSPSFVQAYPQRIINIHHSFLPAFAGSRPYHQAFDRGVKIIGATSHYVTEDLDAGPIIAQSTLPVDHRDTIDDLIRKGRDLERVVLAGAVRMHVQDKILVSGNKTVVFE